MKAKTFLFVFLLFLVGCTSQQIEKETSPPPKKVIFTSDTFSFSFEYPSNWVERSEDLPNNWAILDETKNTILFTVNKAQYDNVALLGRIQALRDYHPGKDGDSLAQEDVDIINQVVKQQTFNGESWYTYAIDFTQKQVTTIVSGMVCGGNEVTVVLVTQKEFFENNQEVYIGLLETFSCTYNSEG